MDHGLELISPRLEILEIEVCNIIYKPRDIGNLIFSTSSYPENIGNLSFFNFLISWKYWIVRSILSPILEILEISFSIFLISKKYWKYDFSCFLGFLQKRRAPKFHAEWSCFRGEISHMRPIQARKLKLFQTPISR